MENQGESFWKTKSAPKEDKPEPIAMEESELAGMKISGIKPIFEVDTECKILDVEFFKVDKKQKNKESDDVYIPFSATFSFQEVEGQQREFKISYSGGRLYDKEGKTTTYIGPKSQLGKIKDKCVKAKIALGAATEWATNMKGKNVMLKKEPVNFDGDIYEKNMIQRFI